jgi:C4-dicarboxylate-binding protein DctP
MKQNSDMSKKILLLLVLCSIAIMAGCGNSSSSQTATSSTNEDFIIRMGHSNSPDENNIITYASNYFSNRIKELTSGKIKVEIYPLNQLGNDRDQVTALQNGSQEMNYTSVMTLAPFCPPLYYFSLPYILTGPEEAIAAVRAMWDKNDNWLITKSNLRTVSYAFAGFRNLTTSAKYPVTNLASAKGIKIRIPPNAISEAAFRTLGFEPVAMDFSEVFTSLQQGVIDGQENCLTAVRSDHFYEVQAYETDIQWQYNLGMFTISEPFFQKLPENFRNAIISTGKEMTELEIKKFEEMDADDIKFLQEKGGLKFLDKPTDYDQWVAIGKSIWADQYSLIGGGDAAAGKAILDEVLGIIAKK